MKNIISHLQQSDACKIQLALAINFISSKDGEEEHVIHSSIDNIKFAPYSDANDVIDELLRFLFSRYWTNIEALMRGRDFIFDSVQLIY